MQDRLAIDFVDILPPGPELRAKLHCNSSSGIVIDREITIIADSGKKWTCGCKVLKLIIRYLPVFCLPGILKKQLLLRV